MTNEEQWPLGCKVKFDYDGLQSKGIIIRHKFNTAIVLIDLNEGGGWEIDEYEAPDFPQYFGRHGWHVGYAFLQRLETKLGNMV